MKTYFPLIVGAGAVLLVSSCDSSRDDTGIKALGIHSSRVEAGEISHVTLVREIDGVRSVWLEMETQGKDLDIHIQLGLPDKMMRAAIGSKSVATASTFEPDVISGHPFASIRAQIRKPGEHVLLETQDDKFTRRNKILLIAK